MITLVASTESILNNIFTKYLQTIPASLKQFYVKQPRTFVEHYEKHEQNKSLQRGREAEQHSEHSWIVSVREKGKGPRDAQHEEQQNHQPPLQN